MSDFLYKFKPEDCPKPRQSRGTFDEKVLAIAGRLMGTPADAIREDHPILPAIESRLVRTGAYICPHATAACIGDAICSYAGTVFIDEVPDTLSDIIYTNSVDTLHQSDTGIDTQSARIIRSR